MKKYGTLEEVVIEMPRDRNSEEQKKWEKERQKKNEKELAYIEKKLAAEYNILLSPTDFSNQKQLGLKLKLWNEQDGKCLYSGKTIEPEDLIKHSELFQIDHIIPRSISFDEIRRHIII